MAKFNISYNIIAKDKFSRIANTVKNQARKMQSVIDSTVDNQVAKNTMLGRSYARTFDTIKGYSKIPPFNFKPALGSFRTFLKKIDKLSFKAFLAIMNIGLPIFMIFKKPFEDLQNEQRSAINLTNKLGEAGEKAIAKVTSALSKKSMSSKADLLQGAVGLAQQGASTDLIKKMMPVITDMVANSPKGTSSKQIVDQIKTALISKQTSVVGGVTISGSDIQSRFKLLMQNYSKIQGTAIKQSQTPINKMIKSFQNLGSALEKMLDDAKPVFTTMATIIGYVADKVSALATKHATLAKYIIGFIVVVLGAIATLVILGAVFSTVAMAGGALLTLFKVLPFMVGASTTALGALAAVIRIVTAAIIANPIGAIAALVLGLISYMLISGKSFKSLFENIGNVLLKVGKAFLYVGTAIKNAILSVLGYVAKKMSGFIELMLKGLSKILHGVGYFSSTSEKWAKSIDKVTASWDKMAKSQKDVISNQKSLKDNATLKAINANKKVLNSTGVKNASTNIKNIQPKFNMAKAGNIINFKEVINRTLGVDNNLVSSNINKNINNNVIHLYQDGHKNKTIETQGNQTSHYNLGGSTMGAY